MNAQLVIRILQKYDVKVAQILPMQKGYRNQSYPVVLQNGHIHNLILYKREPGILANIQQAHYVTAHLDAAGLPVRVPVNNRILCLRGKKSVAYCALYIYLPGATIPWEQYTMEHIKTLGAGLSNMHAGLQTLKQGNLPPVTEECIATHQRMCAYFTQPGVQKALQQKLQLTVRNIDFAPLLQQCAALPKQQALHMDFVRGNILFDEAPKLHISGILDFEKTAWGHPVFDIARTLAFLLVDCKYKPEAKVRKYFLLSGYNKRGKATFNDWRLLEPLVDFFLTYDFYKFLRHNPYEYLEQNEHYVRTRDFLLKRHILVATAAKPQVPSTKTRAMTECLSALMTKKLPQSRHPREGGDPV